MREKLIEFGKNITACLIIDDILKISFQATQFFFEASILSIALYNKEKKGLNIFGIRKGEEDSIYHRFEDMSDKNRWSVYCYQSQEDILCGEHNQYPGKHFSNTLFNDPNNVKESFIYVPINLHNKQIGVLSVQSLKKNAFTQFHLDVVKNLGVYIAIALANAELFKQSEKQKNELEELTEELKEARDHLEAQVLARTKMIVQQKKEIEEQNAELVAQSESILEQSYKLEQINIELERLSLVARKTDNAIMIMDATGNILWLNECFIRLYEYTQEKFKKTRGTNILQTSFNPNIKETLEKCLTTKQPVHYDALNIKGDGTEVWTHTTLTPVLDEKANITHLLTIDSDITQLIEAQHKIEKQSRDITDSIHYASKIQHAILPSVDELKQVFSDYFIVYRPRNIVSGDFYWWYRKNNKFVVALADCTGHGVPGAFMSMLGVSFLNEIATFDTLQSSAQILEQLRRKIKSSLKQTGKNNETADGMDIALCIIDTDTNKMTFSGAFNSLLVYRTGYVKKYKGNKMPIGIYITDDTSFTDHEIDLQKNDRFYLFTDGVTDQFGGTKDRKFSSKRLKDIIVQHGNKPMNEQMKTYNELLDNWMKTRDYQLDDISIIGFELL